MIVEYVGISGVGKTTTVYHHYEHKSHANHGISWPRRKFYENKGWLLRNLLKCGTVLGYSLFHPKWIRSFCRLISQFGIKSIIDNITVVFNGIHLKSMLEKCNAAEVEYLFDEGVFQFAWGIYLRSSQQPTQVAVSHLVYCFGAPDRLIVVEADDDIIASRLVSRASWTKILEDGNLRNKIVEMKKSLSLIINFSISAGLLNTNQITFFDNN